MVNWPANLQEWKEGEAYELIKGRLYFASHPDEDYTFATINANKYNYYFSSDLPGKPHLQTNARPIASPADALLLSCCRRPRLKPCEYPCTLDPAS